MFSCDCDNIFSSRSTWIIKQLDDMQYQYMTDIMSQSNSVCCTGAGDTALYTVKYRTFSRGVIYFLGTFEQFLSGDCTFSFFVRFFDFFHFFNIWASELKLKLNWCTPSSHHPFAPCPCPCGSLALALAPFAPTAAGVMLSACPLSLSLLFLTLSNWTVLSHLLSLPALPFPLVVASTILALAPLLLYNIL